MKLYPTRTPDWAVGMQKLATGAYCDNNGNLHFSEEEICVAFGVPFTEANARIARETAIEVIKESFPGFNVEEITHRGRGKQ